jgi:ATP-dependent helicase HrpB
VRQHPVDIIWVGEQRDPLPQRIVGTVLRAMIEQEGDVLVFLPGVREIRHCQEALADLEAPSPTAAAAIEILPLHGQLPSDAQDRVLRGRETSSARRVILATDIAETSLTIPGIGVVIDAGLTRKPRFDPSRGLSALHTEPISQAAADQRAGRAGRLGPGVCYRLWSRTRHSDRPAQRPAEILNADLAPLALQLAAWGLAAPDQLCWLDSPPPAAWQRARALLAQLGALDPTGRITPLGQAMAKLPVHPRLGAMLCAASPAARPLAADLGALLSEPDALRAPAGPAPVDLGPRLRALDAWRAQSASAGNALAPSDGRRLGQIARAAKQLLRLLATAPTPRGAAASTQVTTAAGLLALASPDRIARQRGQPGHYRISGGGGARLPQQDALLGEEFLAIAELEAPNTAERAGADGLIRLALPLSAAELAAIFPTRIEEEDRLLWDSDRAAVVARRQRRLGSLVLAEQTQPIADRAAAAALLLEQVRADFHRALDWRPAARQLQARIGFLHRHRPAEGWPDCRDNTLQATLETWLAPWLEGKTRLAETRALDLCELLRARLDWAQQQRLEELAPSHWITPASKRHPLDYGDENGPILAVPLQELFGTDENPRILGGELPVTLHLLSPARRPLQITRDLASFWRQGYPEVRRELRGRYPKHHWPEAPQSAQAMPLGRKPL